MADDLEGAAGDSNGGDEDCSCAIVTAGVMSKSKKRVRNKGFVLIAELKSA
jgi:hypothetical protein